MTTNDVDAKPIYYDPYDYEIDSDPHPVWKRMRDEQPVYWNEKFQFWAISRFDDVWQAYQDTTSFSSSHGVQLETLDKPVEFATMIFMDPPEHDNLRKLVSRAFTPRRVNELETDIVRLVDGMLDPHVGEPNFDYVSEFGAVLPPIVIGALLGVPEADRDALRHWFDEIMHREDGTGEMSDAATAAGLQMWNYVAGMITERRSNPTDDLVSALLEAEIEQDGAVRRLTDDEMIGFVGLLAGAGVETVARMLSWAAVLLARNPVQRQLLVDDPSLIPIAIEEILRYEAPSPVNGRWLTRPVEIQGITIPAESKVLLLNGSANRDPREFENPDQFDVTRQSKRHISFGYGAHFCLGAALARIEGRLALEGTLRRFPTWEIDDSELVMVRTSTVRGFSNVRLHVG